MPIPTDVASLAVSVAVGALKLEKRLDQIQAEETALRSALSLGFPSVVLDPSDRAMRTALNKLERSTRQSDPDPLGSDRVRIVELRDQDNVSNELFALCKRYGLLEGIAARTFRPDAAFRNVLLARSQAWDLGDVDIRELTFFVAAGPDLRANSLGFRIGATLLDVLAEVAAANARHVIGDEPTRKLVENVLTRFSEPDLSTLSGWGAVLQQALRATLNAVIDEREALAGGNELVTRLLSALARARQLSGKGDDFVLGILKGRGMNALIRGALTEAADVLSHDEAEAWEEILSDVLLKAAEKAEGARSFEEFFQANWNQLIAAGLSSLREHGPRLLDEDDKILKATLEAAVGALADAFEEGVPNGETLVSVVEASISVFSDPGVLDEVVREEWLKELIASVAETVSDRGLRASFSAKALERYARDALEVFSRYPDLLATNNELVQGVVSGVLGTMATVQHFEVGSLADAAVEGALTAISENRDLLNLDFASVVGDLAAGLAERVAAGRIAGLQAEAITSEVTKVVSTNQELFLVAREGLANTVVEAVLDASEEDSKGLLAGAALVAAVRRVLRVVAVRGRLLPADLANVEGRLKKVIGGGLAEASTVLGRRLAQENIPAALAELIDRLARGEALPDPGTAEFRELFGEISDGITSNAA